MKRQRIEDGVYLAVLADGTIAGGRGITRANSQPKAYTTLTAAVRRAGPGGRVIHATDVAVKTAWRSS